MCTRLSAAATTDGRLNACSWTSIYTCVKMPTYLPRYLGMYPVYLKAAVQRLKTLIKPPRSVPEAPRSAGQTGPGMKHATEEPPASPVQGQESHKS